MATSIDDSRTISLRRPTLVEIDKLDNRVLAATLGDEIDMDAEDEESAATPFQNYV